MLAPYTHRNRNLWDAFGGWNDWNGLFRDNESSIFRTDIREEDGAYILEADLPGFRKEDINVDLGDGTLTISARRSSESEQRDKKNNFVRCERSFGTFSRSFDTTGIDTDAIKAAYHDGVLQLTLPKQQAQIPATKRLEIE